ncbi:MAG: hypothetical protein ACRCTP_02095 [Aeromonas popoffii]|uniref:hypothetical protein n=1 Tax=Aeromonas popoffii TaxID=70856 RepID=UPI003F319CF4
MTKIAVFENLDYLQTVRNNHLNPLIRKVENEIVPVVERLDQEMHDTFKDVTLTTSTNTLKFDRGAGGYKEINLTPILPEFEGIGVENEQGTGPSSGITLLQLKDASITRSGETANIEYNWPKIIGDNVKDLGVGTIAAGTKPTKFLFFRGANVVYTEGGAATVDIPTPPSQIMASLPGTPATAIKEIVLAGDTSSSNITNDKLTINLNSGGGVAPVSNDNFLGFFESLGDLESKVTNPVNGKSYAFAKDSKLGGNYYTPYFYVNGSWKELRQDPALTYSGPKDPVSHGVFTIKPSEKISVDANGQLDLDGLSTPQLPSYFKGFFTSLDELKVGVPNPVLHQDWAYVRNSDTGGLLAYRADLQGVDRVWSIIAPLGSLAVVDRSATPNNYKQAFGIYKDSNWDMDSKGILSLKSIDTSTDVTISDYQGQTSGGKITKMKFVNGKSFVGVDNGELTFNHPQRVMNYNSAWERAHATEDYRGNIYYDATSHCWMGWADPEAGGAVGAKWTRIAHADMSLEVKDLVRRVPAKSPAVTPGILGDSGNWAYNGITFLDKTSEHLPEDLKNVCGGYITTTVQDDDKPGVTIPQHRIQSCAADRAEGGTWVRRYISTGTPGSDVSWSPWIRTSFSHKDIEAHQHDVGAHREAIKYHVVFALAGKMSAIFSQTAGDSLGGLHEDNGLMIVDNYGYTNQDKDYMDPPYSGMFRIAGTLSFAGYKENEKKFPVGRWQILFRKRNKDGTGYAPVAQFTYEHTDEKTQYPLLSFLAKDLPLEDHQEVVINISFSNTGTLMATHPDIYLAPTRTFLVLEDNETTTGTLVAEAHRKLYGSLDVIGDVGIKSHHSRLTDPSSSIRVYGEKLSKTPQEMNKVP